MDLFGFSPFWPANCGSKNSLFSPLRLELPLKLCIREFYMTFYFILLYFISMCALFIRLKKRLHSRGQHLRKYIAGAHIRTFVLGYSWSLDFFLDLLLLLLLLILSRLSQSLLVFFLCISRAQTMHLEHQLLKSIILFTH